MEKIALVTDVTADLTPEIIKEHNVHVIPLTVRFGEREYLSGELSSDEFYQKLAESKELPKTSQPSPDDFQTFYSRLLENYREIISLHLSSGLSGTVNAAHLAKENLKANIHIIDTKSISLGMGLMVGEAARQIKEGLEALDVVERLAKARKNIETLFTVNTLEYLQKGGRIGKVQGLMGTLLNIKPIVRVGDDGIYHSYGKARGQERALLAMVDAFRALAKGRRHIRMAVAHGAAHQAGAFMKEALENALQIPATMTQVGPVIGVHTGPGTVGAAVQFE